MLWTNPILRWTLESVTIGAVLACLVYLACKCLRPGPATRHALWLVVLLKLLTPPLVAWPWAAPNWFTAGRDQTDKPTPPPPVRQRTLHPLTDPPLLMNTPGSGGYLLVVPEPVAPASTHGVIPSEPPAAMPAVVRSQSTPFPAATAWVVPLAGAIWLTGTVVFAAIQAVRVVRLCMRLRRSRVAGTVLCRRVEETAIRLGVSGVETRLVAGIGSPLIFALVRPQLLWPEELNQGISDESVRGLIVHELAHLKRRDHWVGWLELLAGCLWWWNPLYWYVRHQLRENAELACDAWVVGTLPRGRRAYAEALLAVCESMSRPASPIPALGVGTGSRRFLKRRLTMIIQGNTPFRLQRIGLFVTAILMILSVPAWSQKAPDDPDSPRGLQRRVEAYQRAVAETAILEQGGQMAPNGRVQPALPDAAREVVERFERQDAEARDLFDRENARRRTQAIDRLEALADSYAESGLVKEAAAVRAAIKRIQELRRTAELAGNAASVLPDPGNLTSYRDRVGQSFTFRVTGAVDGIVWGTDLYTDDSSLATAAVHAGLVKPDEQAVVRVKIVDAAESYDGSTRNGVTTTDYGQWFGSFRFEPAAGGQAGITTLPADGTVDKYRGQDNLMLLVLVTGSTVGTIWGDGIYTDDSPVAVAAVHAGVLRDGEQGVVAITIRPGRDSYSGSTQNGVTSHPYGGFPGSYRVGKADFKARIVVAPQKPAPAPALSSLRGKPGEVLYISVVGSTAGTVWGSDVYTDDSSLAAAAVHAGLLRDGEQGIVKVTIEPAQDSYTGSTRNGVETLDYADWGGSFRLERLPEGFTPPKVYRWSAPVYRVNWGAVELRDGNDAIRR